MGPSASPIYRLKGEKEKELSAESRYIRPKAGSVADLLAPGRTPGPPVDVTERYRVGLSPTSEPSNSHLE